MVCLVSVQQLISSFKNSQFFCFYFFMDVVPPASISDTGDHDCIRFWIVNSESVI